MGGHCHQQWKPKLRALSTSSPSTHPGCGRETGHRDSDRAGTSRPSRFPAPADTVLPQGSRTVSSNANRLPPRSREETHTQWTPDLDVRRRSQERRPHPARDRRRLGHSSHAFGGPGHTQPAVRARSPLSGMCVLLGRNTTPLAVISTLASGYTIRTYARLSSKLRLNW
jgi:hypothetical protein